MKKRTTGKAWTIGLDLGDRRSQVCVLDEAGEVEAEFRVATTQKGLEKGLARYPGARVVLEVGTHSPWVSATLEAKGFEVIVANPRRLRSITHSDRKDDRTDAEQLARLGRADPKLLGPIRHRGLSAQRDRALLAVRDGLVRCRALLVNQARGLAKPLGLRLPTCTTEGFASRMRREGLQEAFPGMPELVATIDELTLRIRALDRQIEAVSRERYPETELLRQVSGVGPVTALAYVLTIEDPQRFRRSRSVGAYLGLRPRRRQSGEQDPLLRITKAGDPYLRRLLVQSAHYILGPFGPDTDLRRFGLRLMARGGRAGRKKALVAVARKLAVLLHRLWVTAEVYEPLRGVEAEDEAA
ncbi:MAG: IS110 family transposase [Alphaproteobacteria bacterium]